MAPNILLQSDGKTLARSFILSTYVPRIRPILDQYDVTARSQPLENEKRTGKQKKLEIFFCRFKRLAFTFALNVFDI